MTEKEKRDLGYLYDPNYDPESQAEVGKCKNLCHKFKFGLYTCNAVYCLEILHKFICHTDICESNGI